MLGLGLGVHKSINRVSGAPTLQQIVDNYGFLNFWSAENLNIVGTTTTALDYKGIHNLVNPAATNQPTFNSASANFNGKPTLTFSTDDALEKAITGFRGGDATGVTMEIFRIISGTTIFGLGLYRTGFSTPYINQTSVTSNAFRFINTGGVGNRSMRGSTNITTGSFICSTVCTGSEYLIVVNGNNDIVTAITGANNGASWFDDGATTDILCIGKRDNNVTAYSNIEWFASGYMPYTDLATIQNAHNDLRNYLGI